VQHVVCRVAQPPACCMLYGVCCLLYGSGRAVRCLQTWFQMALAGVLLKAISIARVFSFIPTTLSLSYDECHAALPVTIAFVLMIGTGRAHSLTHSAVARLPPTSALIRSRCVCLRRFRLLGSEEHRATRRQSIPLPGSDPMPESAPGCASAPMQRLAGASQGRARAMCASWAKPVGRRRECATWRQLALNRFSFRFSTDPKRNVLVRCLRRARRTCASA
jgi:hypothetical protein